MSVEGTEDIVVPTSPSDRNKIKMLLAEMTQEMSKADYHRKNKTEIAGSIQEQFGIPKKIVNKLASAMYKNNYDVVAAENEGLETLYETLMSTPAESEED